MCDSLALAPARSASGATLFAKNSDRNENECQPFEQHPAAIYVRGAITRCTHIEIPQVAETYRVMGHSPWWLWGFEHGVNEHGVAVGNQTVFSREPIEDEPGLIGMDLVRLALERSRDAREAVEVIAGLIERYGQGGSALAPGKAGYHNSFTIADPMGVWLLETTGRRWAARQTEAGSLTNQITLGRDWDIASRDIETFARAEGWWRDDGRIDIAAAYRNERVPGIISEGRLRRSQELIAAQPHHDTASLVRTLRDHLATGIAPDPSATAKDDRYYTLCMHAEPVGTTTASLVAELPTDREAPWPVWISFGTPCTGIFIPVYIDAPLPFEFARGGESPSESSAWWKFRELQRAASADFARHTPALRKAWAPLEEQIEAERREVEPRARKAVIAGDRAGANELLVAFMRRTADRVLARAAELTSTLMS